MAAKASEPKSSQNEALDDAGQQVYPVNHYEINDSEIWESPKTPTIQIYEQTMFSRFNFLKNYKIKFYEKNFGLENKREDIALIPKDAIRKYKRKYDFLHVGMVQVTLRRCLRAHLNAVVLICLRDAAKDNLRDSILVAFESSASVDPVNFNWYPDYALSLSDLTNFEALAVTIQPHGYHVVEGCMPLAIGYRIWYKLMKKRLEPKCLVEGPKLEFDTRRGNRLVPTGNGNRVRFSRRIPWHSERND